MSSYPSASRPRSNSTHLDILLSVSSSRSPDKLPSKPDTKLFSILFILYAIQGIGQGLFLYTIPTYLLEKGATFNDITTITFSYAPFCFKFLLAPILNNKFSRSFGRGKTYLVPSQYCLSVLMIILSFYGKSLVDLESMPTLDIISVLATFCLMTSDIVMDNWVVNLTNSKGTYSLGTIGQNIGPAVGLFISFIILLPLSSPEFCKNYLYSTPHDIPVLPMHQFILVFGISVLLTALYIHFYMEEPEIEEDVKFYSFSKVVEVLQISFENRHLRKLLFTFFTWNFMFGPIHSIYPSLIVSLGISKELFTGIYTPVIPIELGLSLFIGDLCKQYSEIKVTKSLWILRLLSTFIVYGACINVANSSAKASVSLLFIASLLSQITFTGTSAAFMSHAARVSNETYGAPLLAIFSGIGWTSRFVTEWVAFTMLDYMQWETLGAFSLVALLVYAVLLLKGPLEIETKISKEFSQTRVKFE